MGVVSLPSGAQIELRALRGKEGKLLSDRDVAKSGMIMDKLLAACTVQVLDWGPYAQNPQGVFNWQEALVGDRFYAMVELRRVSFGDEFTFKMQCPSELCRKRFEFAIDLGKMPVRRLSDAARTSFSAGNQFELINPADGKRIVYRLPVGRDEVAAARVSGLDGALVEALLQRIVSVEGEQVTRVYLENLDLSAIFGLLDALDQANCGVETDMEVECPECGHIFDARIPFEQGFLVPGRKTKK